MLPGGYCELASALKTSECRELGLDECQLNKEKLGCLADGCLQKGVQLTEVNIWDRKLSPEGFHELPTTLKAANCQTVYIGNSDLSKDKVSQFAQGCEKVDCKLTKVSICDKKLSPEGFHELPTTLKAANCQIIYIENSDLSKEKVSQFAQGCEKVECNIENCSIRDDSMLPGGYCELASALKTLKCQVLGFYECQLNKEKLGHLTDGCCEELVQLTEVSIWDKKLSAEGFHELPTTLKVTNCQIIGIGNSDLSEEKVSQFAQGCEKVECKLIELKLSDGKLSPEGFHEIPTLLKTTECKNVALLDCNLSKEKVSEFGKGCEAVGCKIEKCHIRDESMLPVGYCKLASAMKTSECQVLGLEKCQLNKEKLDCLANGCLEEAVQLTEVSIWDKKLSPEGFCELPATLKAANCQIIFIGNSDLSKEKVSQFAQGCEKVDCKLKTLYIIDHSLACDAYWSLGFLLKAAKCNLILDNCNINRDGMNALYYGCQSLNFMIPYLLLSNKGFSPSDELISVLCELMRDVVEKMDIQEWLLVDQQKQELMNVVLRQTSKVTAIRLPGMLAWFQKPFSDISSITGSNQLSEDPLQLRQSNS